MPKVVIRGIGWPALSIELIKLVKATRQVGLKEAKDAVDEFWLGRCDEIVLDSDPETAPTLVAEIAKIGFLAEIEQD